MAIPFNLADLIKATPANQVVDENLINARNIFGIDEDYLLKDYTDYYINKPPSLNRDEGIVTLPIDTNVISQGGGEGEREELGPVSPRKRNTGDTTETSTGGISDLQNQLSQGIGMQSIMDAYQDVKDNSGDDVSFEEFMDRTAPFGKNPITGVAYKEPRTIADQNKIFGYAFSDPSKFTGITSLKDFLPGGKYSLTGMAMSGLKGINNAIQGTNFAKAKTLADYRDMMSYGGYEEREAAREKTMADARDLQKDIDAGKYGKSGIDDRNMGQDIDKDKDKKSAGYSYADTPGGGQTQGEGNGGQNNSGGAGDNAGTSGGTGGRRGGAGRFR